MTQKTETSNPLGIPDEDLHYQNEDEAMEDLERSIFRLAFCDQFAESIVDVEMTLSQCDVLEGNSQYEDYVKYFDELVEALDNLKYAGNIMRFA